MPRKKATTVGPGIRQRAAKTPDGREAQLISRAIDLAEQQLIDGTASSRVIVHYLKLAASDKRIEKEKLELEKELLRAKTEAITSQKNADEMYKKALDAMRGYAGFGDDDEEEIF